MGTMTCFDKGEKMGTLVSTSTNMTPVDLREDGLLWLINRAVLHPRGFALGISPDGKFDLIGDGKEPWHFAVPCEVSDPDHVKNIVNEQEKYEAVEAPFERARQSG